MFMQPQLCLQESYRVTHNRDIVPSVPLQIMGFHHVAREVSFMGDTPKYAGIHDMSLVAVSSCVQ